MQTGWKYPLIALQLAGIILSAMLLAVTFFDREEVEARVQAFAVAQVEVAADEAWASAAGVLDDGGRAERLGALAERFGLEAAALDTRRREVLPALMAYALSDRCTEACGLTAAAAIVGNVAMLEDIGNLRVGQSTLQDFIVERYDDTVRGLIADLRRFAGVNLVALSLMLGLVLFRGYLNWRFSACAVAVPGYTAVASYNYVYSQNWAMTLLFQDWAGPVYQGMMICACLLFADWLFLRGIVTRLIADAVASALPG